MKKFTLEEGDVCAEATLSAASHGRWTTEGLATKDALKTLPDELIPLFISSEPEYCGAKDFGFVDVRRAPFATDSNNSNIFNIVDGQIVIN